MLQSLLELLVRHATLDVCCIATATDMMSQLAMSEHLGAIQGGFDGVR